MVKTELMLTATGTAFGVTPAFELPISSSRMLLDTLQTSRKGGVPCMLWILKGVG